MPGTARLSGGRGPFPMTLSSARFSSFPSAGPPIGPVAEPGAADIEALPSLEAGLEALRERLTGIGRDAGLRRVVVPIRDEDLDPLRFLSVQPSGSRLYFRSRDGVLALAGCGIAMWLEGPADRRLAEALDAAPDLLCFLAERFDPDRESAGEWSAFRPRGLAIPLIELRREAGRLSLAAHAVLGPAAALEALERLNPNVCRQREQTLPPEYAPGLGADAGVDSSPQAWRGAVDATLAEIVAGNVRKIVLARTRRFRLPEPVDPCVLLDRLGEGEPGTYRFLVEPEPGVAFLGASPERLFRREGRLLKSEAIAGTRPRGATPEADAALASQLFDSGKERNEHSLVLERIRERLGALSERIRTDRRPQVLRLASVQHLATSIEADLSGCADDAELLARLHPTPAVCGEPLERARTIIRACEPFDRGLYAGPIGVVGAASDVCVAIRSALVVGDRVTAFAGAGVVAGSNAEAEWRETEHKLATFERIVSGPRL